MTPLQLTVVVPAYNEAARIQACLRQVSEYFTARDIGFEVLVVDDGSTDETADLVAGSAASEDAGSGGVRLLKNGRNRGKGFSVRHAMMNAKGRFALLTDADLSAPIREYEKLERQVTSGLFDIAIGSRDIEGSRVEVHQSALRENSGKLFNRMVRLLFGLPYRDTQCGFKLFNLDKCRPIFSLQRTERFGFDVELLVIARQLGLSVREVPVTWKHDSGSKVNFVRDGARMVLDLLAIRWNALRGRYREASAGGN